MAKNEFTEKVIHIIRSIPKGKISTYGNIACMAGNRQAARQVSRILHSCSCNENLPWHRVVNKEGEISLSDIQGGLIQREKLEQEGVQFDPKGKIDMDLFLWEGGETG